MASIYSLLPDDLIEKIVRMEADRINTDEVDGGVKACLFVNGTAHTVPTCFGAVALRDST